MAHLTHLDTHARTILKCFMSCFSTDYKDASVDALSVTEMLQEPSRVHEKTRQQHICTIIVKEDKTKWYKFGTTVRFTQQVPFTLFSGPISGRGERQTILMCDQERRS